MTTGWTHLPTHPGSYSKPTEEVALIHERTYAHTVQRAAGHAQTPSIYFSLLQYHQLEARLGRVALQLCARWAVIDTRPQTWVVSKRYRKDPAGSRDEAARDVTDAADSALSFVHIQLRTHKHKHIKDRMWHRLGFIWYDCNLGCTRQ